MAVACRAHVCRYANLAAHDKPHVRTHEFAKKVTTEFGRQSGERFKLRDQRFGADPISHVGSDTVPRKLTVVDRKVEATRRQAGKVMQVGHELVFPMEAGGRVRMRSVSERATARSGNHVDNLLSSA